MADRKYVLVTDSDSELPLSLVQKYRMPYVPMPYTLKGQEYFYDFGETTDFTDFYAQVRAGEMPTTSTFPPQYYVDLWRPYLEQGQDILHVSFSSQLSSAYSFLCTAAQELREEFPERQLITFDTKSISGGMAVLLYGALKLWDAGATLQQTVQWLQENTPHATHVFTVDDLNHLYRGGRLSASSAMVGSMLKLKPILVVDDEGAIKAADKVMGRQKAIHYLANAAITRAVDPAHNALVVLHADCEDDARKLLWLVNDKVQFAEVFFQYVGPVIGSHCGPGTLGICFLGDKR
ncbi:MAG: DegV family protein [Eubacteriales bacterium]|nr:DegV family protein [Eubacteriales bacterium]